MNTQQPLPDHEVHQLVDPHHFDLLFFQLIKNTTCENAYEYLEDNYQRIFKRRRYKNYESYRIAKHNRRKK